MADLSILMPIYNERATACAAIDRVLGEDVLVRLAHDDADRALAEPNTRVFDMTGRPARGMVVVSGASVTGDADLAQWIDAGADHAASLPPK